MANGEFCRGNKFINKNALILEGSLIKWMCVSDEYVRLAEFLGCTDVLEIHYSDIDVKNPEVSDTDIEDILESFVYKIEILKGMYLDNLLSKEQIEK